MDRAPRDRETRSPASARDRILLSAASLFAGGRIRVTGVDALIARADVAKATFYRHFPSKDDVVAGWLQRPEARWLDVVVGELEDLHRSFDWSTSGGRREGGRRRRGSMAVRS